MVDSFRTTCRSCGTAFEAPGQVDLRGEDGPRIERPCPACGRNDPLARSIGRALVERSGPAARIVFVSRLEDRWTLTVRSHSPLGATIVARAPAVATRIELPPGTTRPRHLLLGAALVLLVLVSILGTLGETGLFCGGFVGAVFLSAVLLVFLARILAPQVRIGLHVGLGAFYAVSWGDEAACWKVHQLDSIQSIERIQTPNPGEAVLRRAALRVEGETTHLSRSIPVPLSDLVFELLAGALTAWSERSESSRFEPPPAAVEGETLVEIETSYFEDADGVTDCTIDSPLDAGTIAGRLGELTGTVLQASILGKRRLPERPFAGRVGGSRFSIRLASGGPLGARATGSLTGSGERTTIRCEIRPSPWTPVWRCFLIGVVLGLPVLFCLLFPRLRVLAMIVLGLVLSAPLVVWHLWVGRGTHERTSNELLARLEDLARP